MSTAADNITLNLGSGGPVVHTDYITGQGHIQYVKLDIGDANASSEVTTSNPLPISVASLPANWTTIPVAGGTNGQGVNIAGVLEVAAVGISNGTLDRLIEVKNGVTLGSIASGVVMGVQSPASTSVNIAATAGVIKIGIADGVTVASGGGTIDQVVLVEGVAGVTLHSADGVTIGVATRTGETVSITMGNVNIRELEAPSDITSGIKFVNNLAASNTGDAGVTLPDFEAAKTIEFFNLPGSGTGPIGLSADQSNSGYAGPLAGGFLGAITGGFGGLAGQQVGAIVVLGTTASVTDKAGGGITLGYLAASAGFQLIFPGERLKIPVRDLDDFVFQCMTGPNGETGAALQYVATKY